MRDKVTIDDFLKIDMRVGTIVDANINEKAKKKAYKLTIDFGKNLGMKTSSAQITDCYNADELIGMQIVAIVNFPPRQVANVLSEVLVLGSDSKHGIILLKLDRKVENGDRIY